MRSNTKTGSAVILIMLLILLTWRLPLSQYVRFNMRLVFMWFTVLSLAVYIAANINTWVGGFLALALISSHYPKPTPYSGEALLMVILGAVLYIVFYNIHDKQAIYTAFCLFALANVAFAGLQISGLDFQMERNEKVIIDGVIRQGLLDNRNSLSAALAFCLSAFFRPRWVWLIPVVGLGLVLAKSVGGVLASLPTLLYYFNETLKRYTSNRMRAAICILFLCSSTYIYVRYVDPPNYKSRWAAWRMYGALNTDRHHNKLLGTGIGHWKAVFKRKDVMLKICEWANCNTPYNVLYYAQAHNEPIQVNFEMGIAGTFIIVGFLFNVLRRVRTVMDPRPALALCAIVINSLVYFPMHIPTLAIMVILWLATLENTLAPSSFSLVLPRLPFTRPSKAASS